MFHRTSICYGTKFRQGIVGMSNPQLSADVHVCKQQHQDPAGSMNHSTGTQTQVSVVIPTYQEAQSIRPVLEDIHESLQPTGWKYEIIVVDDDSGDGIDRIIHELDDAIPVELKVRRHERGLATAVLEGFRQAAGAVLVCMDADGSHPASVIPDLVIPLLNDDVEMSLGSRYVAGGSTDTEWTLYRRLNSSLATLLARPLTRARDPLTGFFAIRQSHIQALGNIKPVGYKIALELLVRAGVTQYGEVPIHFNQRRAGESKLSFKVQLAYVRQILALWWYRLIH
jgi:dolichol-phosphate mannosyltransferase